MKVSARSFLIVALALTFLGLTTVAQAKNDRDSQPSNDRESQSSNDRDSQSSNGKNSQSSKNKTCTIWLPKYKLVCKPCKKKPRPPSSTCNPRDTCCNLELVGWYPYNPPRGGCGVTWDDWSDWSKQP